MSDVTITLWRSLFDAENGSRKQLTWDQLGRFLNSPGSFSGEWHGGWSAATFSQNQRGLEFVEQAYALVLDFDGTAVRDVLKALFIGVTHHVHASKSNRADSPRYRAVLQLSKPVGREDYYRVWRAYTKRFETLSDGSCKDPSRFWYRPCRTPETVWEFWSGVGEPLDVDALIAAAIELEAKEEAVRVAMAKTIQLRPEARESNIVTRASNYVKTMDAAISGSHGHDATWKVAFVLVKGFSLDRNTALAILANEYNPRCVPPWSQKDLERKIDQAITKAKGDDGFLLKDRDGWTPARAAKIPPEPPYDDREWPLVPPPGFEDAAEEPVADAPCRTESASAPANDAKAQPEPQAQPEPAPIQTAAERYGAYSAQRLALDVLTDVNKVSEMGCPTGIGEIDLAMCGMRKKMITVFGAPTSMGKTTFAIMSADETCNTKRRPLILSFEDAPLLYGRRLVARRGRLNFSTIRDRDTSMRERAEIVRVAGEAETSPFLVDCIGKTAEYAAQVITDLVREEAIDLVIVDYLQRIKTERRMQDRRNEVTYAMATIADAIKTAGCAGLLLSQLKRLENGKEPSMEDLKESGDIECFAEHIILGWRDIHNDGSEEKFVKLSKNKDGAPIFERIKLDWNPVSACFNATEPPISSRWRQEQDMHHLQEDLDTAIGGY